MLHSDEAFNTQLLAGTIAPTRLQDTDSAPSCAEGTTNRTDALCPYFRGWLTACPRKGLWECEHADNCSGQHERKGGLNCDVEESRCVALAGKATECVQAMTLDEALRYDGPGWVKWLKKCAGEYTCADVWRASTEAVAYGRKELAVAEESDVSANAEPSAEEPANSPTQLSVELPDLAAQPTHKHLCGESRAIERAVLPPGGTHDLTPDTIARAPKRPQPSSNIEARSARDLITLLLNSTKPTARPLTRGAHARAKARGGMKAKDPTQTSPLHAMRRMQKQQKRHS